LKLAPYFGLAAMFALLAVLMFGAVGCASLKSAAAPAGGAAAGAAAGLALGPGGAIAGAGIGAVVAHSVAENASLRSGETVGEGALKKEQQRWNGATAEEWGQRALNDSGALDALKRWLTYAVLGFAGWFLWRNRHNLRDLGPIYGLIHSLGGGKIGKAL
jgi:hypothetical protein